MTVSRRDFLRGAAGMAGLAVTGTVLDACSGKSAGATGTSGTSAGSAGTPKHGGTLTIGLTGGSSSDTVDGFNYVTNVDQARTGPLNEPLAYYAPNGTVVNRLAEEFTPNGDGTVWTVRLKPGLTFHNGKDITADDVIFSFQHIMNPKAPALGAAAFTAVDPNGFKKLDSRTVQVHMLMPQTTLREQMTGGEFPIVPTDYDPHHPIGAGAFKFVSFTPGQRSTMTRFENYFLAPEPYLDQVIVLDFPDSTSQVNALVGGQLNAAGVIPPVSARELASNSSVKVLNQRSGQYIEQCMNTAMAPFTDARVRQAWRLLFDRNEYIDTVFSGQATIGNDVFARYDPDYNSTLSQHEKDVPQALHLLKAAGRSDYAFTIISGPWTAGQLESAEFIAQAATTAGVKAQVANTPIGTFLADDYCKVPFASGYWYDTPYAAQLPITMLKTAGQNETHWQDPAWDNLWVELNKTVDPAKYRDIVHEMQQIEWESGGYIIPAFFNEIDAVASNVHGFEADHTIAALKDFHYEQVWIS